MNNEKQIPIKLFISIFVPLVIATFGGLIVYQTPAGFFYGSGGEGYGPAAVYYGLTLLTALLFFLIRQQYKQFDLIAVGLISLLYSLALKRMTPGVFRPIYVYLVPLLVFSGLMIIIIRYIFLNKRTRAFRLVLFTVLNALTHSGALWLQNLMLKLPLEADFFGKKFYNGIMLFLFMGFGMSVAEMIILRLESTSKDSFTQSKMKNLHDDEDDDE